MLLKTETVEESDREDLGALMVSLLLCVLEASGLHVPRSPLHLYMVCLQAGPHTALV